jgi:putative PIN family toxin of toxin-antitoxin system
VTSSEAVLTVLDTNIVLDLWIFDDPRTQSLRHALRQGRLQWIATAAMREELRRVLGYPHLVARMAASGQTAQAVLDAFDQQATVLEDAPKAPCTCKDGDDQKFIDLAVMHRALLLSKDAQVLCMRRRLERLGVDLNPHIPPPPGFAVEAPQKAFYAALFQAPSPALSPALSPAEVA